MSHLYLSKLLAEDCILLSSRFLLKSPLKCSGIPWDKCEVLHLASDTSGLENTAFHFKRKWVEWGSWEQHFPNAVAFLLPHILPPVLPKGRHIARDPLAGFWELLWEHSHPARLLLGLAWPWAGKAALYPPLAHFFSGWEVQLLPCQTCYGFSPLWSRGVLVFHATWV